MIQIATTTEKIIEKLEEKGRLNDTIEKKLTEIGRIKDWDTDSDKDRQAFTAHCVSRGVDLGDVRKAIQEVWG